MTAESALHLLRSSRPSERLRGARLLAKAGDPSLIEQIRRIRAKESDSWVQSSLDRIIQAWREQEAVVEQGDMWISVAGDAPLEEARAAAIQTVTRTLLHEIRPLVADVEDFAITEMAKTYTASETSKAIRRLRELLRTVQTLHDAAAAPRMVEFDLVDTILSALSTCGFTPSEVICVRDEPVITIGDSGLLRLALVNVVRNAVEASTRSGARVVINCGATGTQAWVAVLDEGEGLPPGMDVISRPGYTTKPKGEHFGWGLSIAQRAINSMAGTMRLAPREGGGTSCELRWIPQTEVELQ